MPLRIGKHRLFRLVLPFVAVILFQAFLASLSLEVLSSVRAYVGGESLWSKGQKDAIHFLTLYSQTGEEHYLYKFKSAVAVPLADRAARYALERETPDLDAAHAGFIGGGNHPADVPGLIRLFRYFRDVPYMARAIACWRATDPFLDQLTSLADAIHQEFANVPDASEHSKARKAQIDLIDRRLAPYAIAFSQNSRGRLAIHQALFDRRQPAHGDFADLPDCVSYPQDGEPAIGVRECVEGRKGAGRSGRWLRSAKR